MIDLGWCPVQLEEEARSGPILKEMSTYMLTWRQLEALCGDEGPLIRWTAGRDGVPPNGRALYLERSVHTDFTSRPWPACEGEAPKRTAARRTAMRSVLERFVRGDVLRVNADMKDIGAKRRDENMRGYFSIRSQGPMTETRFFGFFPRAGAFVATAFVDRDQFSTQEDWDKRRESCREIWDHITDGATFLTDPWPVDTRAQLQAYMSVQDD